MSFASAVSNFLNLSRYQNNKCNARDQQVRRSPGSALKRAPAGYQSGYLTYGNSLYIEKNSGKQRVGNYISIWAGKVLVVHVLGDLAMLLLK